MAALYSVYPSPSHPAIPNHLPTLVVTPHGQPSNILYSYLHTNYNTENYLLTPSPQGDLCVAKLFPPRPREPGGKASASDPGHGSSPSSRIVRCEASRNLKWSIANTGVIAPIYKLSLPSPDSADLPLFLISKPNPHAAFWSMFYFAYAGHSIPPKRIEFGKIQKNQGGGGTRISITGKTAEEKAVWQTLGEGNEDCVEWVVLCAALNLLDDEIMKAAEKNPPAANSANPLNGRPTAVSLRDPAPANGGPPPAGRPGSGPGPGPNPMPSSGPPPNGVPGGPKSGAPMPMLGGGGPKPGPPGAPFPGGPSPAHNGLATGLRSGPPGPMPPNPMQGPPIPLGHMHGPPGVRPGFGPPPGHFPPSPPAAFGPGAPGAFGPPPPGFRPGPAPHPGPSGPHLPGRPGPPVGMPIMGQGPPAAFGGRVPPGPPSNPGPMTRF